MAQFYSVRTDKDVQFTGTLAQNAGANVNVALTPQLTGVNGTGQFFIRALAIESVQNLAWELDFWSQDTFSTTDPDTDAFIGTWAFTELEGKQIGGTGLYRYYIDGLAIPYYDLDNSGELHLSLVNRSTTAKLAGGSGAISVTVWGEPMMWGEGA